MKIKDITKLEEKLFAIRDHLDNIGETITVLKKDIEEDRVTIKEICPHLPDWIESEFSESEQWAVCTVCGKDMTEEVTSYMQAKYDERIPF